ncbi:histidine--tRNA ligase [Deinococcus irradiatisoli]|uniref:Histidine--tRNA ligase n=1 Tax=Deinococcus irradiatisoli TaxID=2202254 RepID=A0A2Z3JGN9_9DEIO|nr:histidine--tRNA ligase [Deinococcus irradiatisoli]AWN23156.1 histidine--tRNA ligase [Deinococcus irradiatisoli]
MALQRPKGTQDHLPDGSPKLRYDLSASAFSRVVGTARQVLERGGAKLIHTPLFEEAELVRRGVGGSTDIVRKEMFTVYYFGDHGGFILRPEGTAGVVRAYLENGLKQLPAPLKLWTHGPMFRAENVQKGRLRQFHQVDYEVIGSADALVDAEAIELMVRCVQQLGLQGARVKLGSIGDPEDRERYNAYLRQSFTPHLDRLSDDSRDRLERNPMRILDSKSASDQALIAELGVRPMLDFLGEDAAAHFAQVRTYLDAWGVHYDVDPSIVRGLDYYRRTAWELHHEGVGAKSALGGGGRYDGLAQELGGPETPAVGWAFGIERVLIALEAEGVSLPASKGPLVFVAALDAENVGLAAQVALQVREVAGAEFAYRALKPGNVFKEAQRRGATYAALIGSEEAARGVVALKHLGSGEQREVSTVDLKTTLLENA